MAFAGQPALQKIGNPWFIFNDQYSHSTAWSRFKPDIAFTTALIMPYQQLPPCAFHQKFNLCSC
jgi:hypothetical protein